MKTDDSALGAFVLTFIYLLMINLMAAKPVSIDSSISAAEKEQQYIIASSQAFFNHTVQFEDLLNSLHHPEKVNFKNLSHHWIAFQKRAEKLLRFAFRNYSVFAVNLSINLKASQLLYPFHFFP